MMKVRTSLAGIAMFAAIAMANSAAASDQEQEDDLLPKAVCFVREASDNVGLSIVVPSQSASAMRAKGFKREPCRKNFANAAARNAYRDEVCHMASTYREEQLVSFENLYGERPGVLCGMAEVAISQWRVRSVK